MTRSKGWLCRKGEGDPLFLMMQASMSRVDSVMTAPPSAPAQQPSISHPDSKISWYSETARAPPDPFACWVYSGL